MFVYRSVDGFVGIDRFLEFQREPAGRYLQVSVSTGCGIDRIFDAGSLERAQIDRSACDDGSCNQRSNECADEERRLT